VDQKTFVEVAQQVAVAVVVVALRQVPS